MSGQDGPIRRPPGRAGAGAPRPGARAFLGNLALGLGVAVVLLVLLEGAARLTLLLLPPPSGETALSNPFDPEARRLYLDARIPLAETLRGQIEENFLTAPDRDLIFRVRPSPAGEAGETCEGINAQGFRGRELRGRSGPGGRRLLILGDSCAFGWGLSRYAETIQGRLEEGLAAFPEPWEVYNLAQPGYSTFQGTLLFRRWFSVVDPDVVVLSFGWNDIWPTPLLTDRQTAAVVRWTNHPVALQARRSALASLLQRALRSEPPPPEGAAYRPRVPLPEVLALLEEMIGAAEARGAKVVLILPPYACRGDLEPALRKLEEWNAAVRGHFDGRATFPRLEAMRCPRAGAWDYFLPDGIHPNRRGAALVASELLAAVRSPAGAPVR